MAERPRDFLAVATPGAGKTTFALQIAAELLATGRCGPSPWSHRPSTSSRSGPTPPPGWVSDSTRASPTPRVRPARSSTASWSPTPRWRRTRCCTGRRTENRKTLVILDEIHHAGRCDVLGQRGA